MHCKIASKISTITGIVVKRVLKEYGPRMSYPCYLIDFLARNLSGSEMLLIFLLTAPSGMVFVSRQNGI